MICKYCQSENVIRYGKLKDVQRYYCKDCQRKFANPSAIPKMQTNIRDVADALNMYYEGCVWHYDREPLLSKTALKKGTTLSMKT